MAKRFTDTEKFSDTWYRKLTVLQKVIWEYLLAECNHAGILENFDLEMMSFKIGAEITQEDLKVFDDRIKFIKSDVLFIPKFIQFQYGELNPQSKVHASVLKELKKYNLDTLSIEYAKGIDTLKDKDIYKDKNKDINKVINEKKNSKKIDKFNNEFINLIKSEYKKVFNQTGMLTADNLQKIYELAENNPDFIETIPDTIRKLKRVDFSEIGYNAKTLCWLFSKDHYEQVYSGTWDFETREEVVERLRNEELQRRKEYAAANGNRPSQ
jgi:hypothetical protein